MPHVFVGGFLVLHGLITTMIGVGAVTSPNSPAVVLPAWFDWWPGPLGRSWLFDAVGLGTGSAVLGGFLWLAAGLALIGGALGWLGVPAVRDLWEPLAFGGATLGLLALALYFHPFYLIAVVINVVVVVLLWSRLTGIAVTS